MTMNSSIAAPLGVLILLLAITTNNVNAFQPTQLLLVRPSTSYHTPLYMAKKKGSKKAKGFGEASTSTASSNKKKGSSSFTTPMSTTPEPTAMKGTPALSNTEFNVMEQSDRTRDNPLQQPEQNQGQLALERMRREQAEKKDAELRRVKEMRDTDRLLQTVPEAAAIPEKVAMRMGKRMLPFVGIPLFGSMGAFVAFWYFATYKNVEFQPAAVAATTIVTLLSGLLGITYSIVSASWDEDREGSFFGIDEFQTNVGNIKEGLARSKENLVLREKMAGLPEEEIEAAIQALDNQTKRQQSFESKMSQELEK